MTEQQRIDHERVRRELWAAIYRQEHERREVWFKCDEAADRALKSYDERFATHGVPERLTSPSGKGNGGGNEPA